MTSGQLLLSLVIHIGLLYLAEQRKEQYVLCKIRNIDHDGTRAHALADMLSKCNQCVAKMFQKKALPIVEESPKVMAFKQATQNQMINKRPQEDSSVFLAKELPYTIFDMGYLAGEQYLTHESPDSTTDRTTLKFIKTTPLYFKRKGKKYQIKVLSKHKTKKKKKKKKKIEELYKFKKPKTPKVSTEINEHSYKEKENNELDDPLSFTFNFKSFEKEKTRGPWLTQFITQTLPPQTVFEKNKKPEKHQQENSIETPQQEAVTLPAATTEYYNIPEDDEYEEDTVEDETVNDVLNEHAYFTFSEESTLSPTTMTSQFTVKNDNENESTTATKNVMVTSVHQEVTTEHKVEPFSETKVITTTEKIKAKKKNKFNKYKLKVKSKKKKNISKSKKENFKDERIKNNNVKKQKVKKNVKKNETIEKEKEEITTESSPKLMHSLLSKVTSKKKHKSGKKKKVSIEKMWASPSPENYEYSEKKYKLSKKNLRTTSRPIETTDQDKMKTPTPWSQIRGKSTTNSSSRTILPKNTTPVDFLQDINISSSESEETDTSTPGLSAEDTTSLEKERTIIVQSNTPPPTENDEYFDFNIMNETTRPTTTSQTFEIEKIWTYNIEKQKNITKPSSSTQTQSVGTDDILSVLTSIPNPIKNQDEKRFGSIISTITKKLPTRPRIKIKTMRHRDRPKKTTTINPQERGDPIGITDSLEQD